MPFDLESAISSAISAKQQTDGEHRLDVAISHLHCMDQSICGPAQASLTNAGHAALEGNISGLETAIKSSPDSGVFIRDLNHALDEAGVPLTLDTAPNNHLILIGLPDAGAQGNVIDMDLTKGTAKVQEAIFTGPSVIFADSTTGLNVNDAAHKIAARALDAGEETQQLSANQAILQGMGHKHWPRPVTQEREHSLTQPS
jgi:hypothetical protein